MTALSYAASALCAAVLLVASGYALKCAIDAVVRFHRAGVARVHRNAR